MGHEINVIKAYIKADDLVFDYDFDEGFVGQEIEMLARVSPQNAEYKDIIYESSDEEVLTVNKDGKIQLLKVGNAKVIAKHKDITKEFELRVYEEFDYLWKMFRENRKRTLNLEVIRYFGSKTHDAPLYEPIFPYLFNDPMIINRSKMLPKDHPNHPNRTAPIEWIVLHDTGGINSDAENIAQYMINERERTVSWNYTVGKDGWYQSMEDDEVSWHASSGSTTTDFTDTGIPAVNQWERPRLTISEDKYFVIKGIKTDYKVPDFPGVNNQVYNFPTLGIWPVIINGTYHIPDVRQRNEGSLHRPHICLDGGNYNGIGIETSVYLASDVWVTWGRTAKLVSNLMLEHDLKADRIVYHNSFNNKKCPQTAITANKVEVWFQMIKFEFMIMKYFSDYEIDIISHSPNFLDERGRVSPDLPAGSFVDYTLKITSPNGEVKEQKFRTNVQ